MKAPCLDPNIALTRRARATALRERMKVFASIYNAAWFLRNYQYGSSERGESAAKGFIDAFVQELKATSDYEALIYAMADAITANSHGVPWEG